MAAPVPRASPAVVQAPPGAPQLELDGSYRFSSGGLELVVDPKRSGRVLRFALDGKNVLVGPELLPDAFGATFWPSPQSDWGWPPPAEIDGQPYTAELEGSALVVTSAPSSQLGLRVVKRYRLDGARRAVEVAYTLVNTTDRPRRVAPWELHRVPAAGGLTFYPSGQRRYPQSTLKLDAHASITWFAHAGNREHKSLKSFADGAEGWVAYTGNGLVLVKSFDDVPEHAHAPGEGEIELFAEYDAATQRHRFVELEQQGPYIELGPGGVWTWNVRWFLRRLPPSIAATARNPELVGFVRGIIE